ncbi:hypothetical protein [Mycobacteroides stephanolepidis]|nr:hypothetical protein [[Mycobacterium] stephanolepidis]
MDCGFQPVAGGLDRASKAAVDGFGGIAHGRMLARFGPADA